MKEKIRNSSIVRRLLSIIAAVVMTLGLVGGSVVPAMAAATGSIIITPPNGAENGQSYAVYKIFDAVGNGKNISYKLLTNKTTLDEAWTSSSMGTYFDVDNAGNVTALPAATGNDSNLSADAVTAIANYVTAAGLQPTITVSEKNDDGKYIANGLTDGYYYITTTTGTVVTIDSVNGQQNVNVSDKNSTPLIDKTIAAVEDNAGSITTDGKSAIAQVGKKVTFNARITIGKGAKGYVFRDTFPTGNKLSLESATIKVYRVPATSAISSETLVTDNIVSNSNYILNTSPTASDKWTFQITFNNEYIKTLSPADSLVVVYDATVTSNALSTDKATNSATISWGDPEHQSTSEPSTTDTYNAKITVNKTFQGLAEGANLANNQKAEFVLKNANNQYYKYDEETKTVTWEDSADNATKIQFTEGGTGTFSGLPNGNYTLSEITVPEGYNKAGDTTFTITAANVNLALTPTNLEQETSIENKTGSTLPSTGGIGTTIFYVIGGVVIAGAVILLIARRRKNA